MGCAVPLEALYEEEEWHAQVALAKSKRRGRSLFPRNGRMFHALCRPARKLVDLTLLEQKAREIQLAGLDEASGESFGVLYRPNAGSTSVAASRDGLAAQLARRSRLKGRRNTPSTGRRSRLLSARLNDVKSPGRPRLRGRMTKLRL